MKTYEEIKKEELETTKGYSDKRLDRYIRLYKVLDKILDVRVLWTISALVFLAIPLTVHLSGIASFGPVIAHFSIMVALIAIGITMDIRFISTIVNIANCGYSYVNYRRLLLLTEKNG